MGFRDLVAWTKNQQLSTGHEAFDPFLALHREMNRLFDDVFRGFGPLGRVGHPLMEGQFAFPGLSENDAQVEIAKAVLSIRGEKKAERSDETKLVSERYYGSFQRQVPLEGVEEDKAQADFKNGVLIVTIPKSEQSKQNVKRIAINTN